MHTNHRRVPRRHHKELYKKSWKVWLKRYFHHSYRQAVREALRWDPDVWALPQFDEVADIWFYD